MESESRIRLARRSDASAVRDIYAPFCESTPVTFEETPPAAAEMADRIASTLETYPWLVCELDGEVVGYAYASRLRKRRAYQWTVELSVYVAESARQSGVGRALYQALFAVLERQGVRDAYAVTTVPNPETERFHERLGFDRCVDFPAIGYTDGDWYDVAWWRRRIGEKASDPEPITPLPALRERLDDADWHGLLRSDGNRRER
ncbi:GNAT family N-acetyltransferase [Natronolimnohabitans innermongolicus]|uniref:N-acetyltransferase GCN5 n=1 Tax=Natronolimnohabitans innermongolicus JCM 12255 TaxID=1227499 RepID=L9X2Y3_9EURY|nr:GNAT family N-acetyltransferase [Natronolimnohabitans innermongolicus]ELY55836.1 N-acetyltransferase GCN5 [Natronolimnohabitans innermongolicus JCM 12255]